MPKLLRRGDPFGSLGIGVPYYKASYQFFRWWSWLLVGGFENGDDLLNTANVPGHVPIPMAHNALVKQFLTSDLDTMCIIEDDHEGDQEVVRRMRNKRENWDFDIVCANYVGRHDGGPIPQGCDFGERNEYGEIECIIDLVNVPRTGTQEKDSAALGLVLIRRWLLEERLAQSTLDEGCPDGCFWFDWRGRNSQDVFFYDWAHQMGARTGVDRDNAIGHIGQKVWTIDDFYEWRKAKLEGFQEA